MSSRVRECMPTSVILPCENTDAVIEIGLHVDAAGVVSAPSLEMLAPALAGGSVTLVRDYCQLWTRYLARVTT